MNDPTCSKGGTETLTVGGAIIISPGLTNDLWANYSHTTGESYVRQDNFGGTTPIPDSIAFPPLHRSKNAFVGLFLTAGVASNWYLGTNVSNS